MDFVRKIRRLNRTHTTLSIVIFFFSFYTSFKDRKASGHWHKEQKKRRSKTGNDVHENINRLKGLGTQDKLCQVGRDRWLPDSLSAPNISQARSFSQPNFFRLLLKPTYLREGKGLSGNRRRKLTQL